MALAFLAPSTSIGDDTAKSKQPLTAKQISEKLRTTVDASFVDTPLKDIGHYFADVVGVPIIIDAKSLEEAAIPVDVPITIDLHGMTLRTTLQVILGQIECVAAPRDGYILITTPDHMQSIMDRRIYRAAELPGAAADGANLSELIETIQTTVEPSQWDAAGGPGRIAQYQSTVVIRQSPDVQDQIDELLHQLQEAIARDSAKTP
jgi:hypothetical protein